MVMGEAVDKDTLLQLIDSLDRNQDGIVVKEEFKVPYMKLYPKLTDEQFDKVWRDIDQDSDGKLSITELATYYGFSISPTTLRKGTGAADMSDDQILEALKLQAVIHDSQQQALLKDAKTPSAQLRPGKKTGELRVAKKASSGVVTVKLPTAVQIVQDPRVLLLQSCDVGDFADVVKLIESGVDLGVEDEKGEMALHKIAKHGDEATLRLVLDKSRKDDINWPDKLGNTPIFFAADNGHIAAVTSLLDCGADYMQENNNGWTVLHAAVNSNEEDVVEAVLSHPWVEKGKLMSHVDTSKRSAVHIAAFKSNEKLVRTLMTHGADIRSLDFAGNAPVTLAKKAGRRKSKDLLEGLIP